MASKAILEPVPNPSRSAAGPRFEGVPVHALPADDVLASLNSNVHGLSRDEAARRLERFGHNELPKPKGKSLHVVFLTQFASPFIYLLLAAAGVSLGLGHVTDAIFIGVVLLSNAGIGTYQEWQAETRARALKALIKSTASVVRAGRLMRLPSEDLVPGDIVQVESGTKVSADLRLLDTHALTVDESLLTGESAAVQKAPGARLAADASLGDRVTMLHAGTTVRTGRGTGVVAATASRTEVGHLAAALHEEEPAPPLVRRMARFSRHLAIATVGLIGIIAAIEIFRGAAVADVFLIAVALAVAAIPEGLPVAMTVALSIAMHRMGLRHVIVRHLPAVEGLGACTFIATDKTGTLTLNRLTVERVWIAGAGDTRPNDAVAQPLLFTGATASEPPADGEDGPTGDAVDLAFNAAAAEQGWHPAHEEAILVERIPYEPEKRFCAVFHSDNGSLRACVKGAPETVMSFCTNAGDEARRAAERLSAEGFRVIAVARGRVQTLSEKDLSGLELIGFAGLIDPLRPEAKAAVAAAQGAGLRVAMVTGDHPLTALAIARQLSLAQDPQQVVSGSDLAKLDGPAFDAACATARVFARTEPLQKLAIVSSLRRQGHLVAVTGDGINDAPALHAADIGIAMGKDGTDLARDTSDLILSDDNFASIVAGVEEGRIAYDNLRKVILLAISTGAAEILLMLLASLSGLPPPLSAVQLLWLNLVTAGIQHVALAFEKGEPDVLLRGPRAADAPILDRRMIEQMTLSGIAMGLIVFAFYASAISGGLHHGAAQGAVLWLMVWCENAHCFNCRSETRSVFRVPLANNPLLIGGVIATQALQVGALAVPSFRSLLSLDALTLKDGLSLAIVGIGILAVMEIYKLVRPPRPRSRPILP